MPLLVTIPLQLVLPIGLIFKQACTPAPKQWAQWITVYHEHALLFEGALLVIIPPNTSTTQTKLTNSGKDALQYNQSY